MDLLIINGHDYSKFIIQSGINWARNDLDSENSTRTKDGRLRRDKIGTKRKLSYDVRGMSRAELAQLDDDLSSPTFQAIYSDLHGRQTREFYCSSFSATMNTANSEGANSWTAASFNITEV